MNKTDQVRLALSRILKIKLAHIGPWELTCGQNTYRALGIPTRHYGGMLDANMRVSFDYENYIADKLQNAQGNVHCIEFRIEETGPFNSSVTANIRLFYGKETQHIFKALAQMFTYRKPAKRKRK